MLSNDVPQQANYTALSQAMTDSDSDDEIEIHNAANHRPKRRLPKKLRRSCRSPPPNALALRETPQNNGKMATSVGGDAKIYYKNPSIAQTTFRAVTLNETNANVDLTHTQGDFEPDNVAILTAGLECPAKQTESPMSAARRACFLGSLVLCILAVAAFLWLAPCNDASSCPAAIDRSRVRPWSNNYTKMELKSKASVVRGLRVWQRNLIFIYRGDELFPEYRFSDNKRNGVICVSGSSGTVIWFVPLVDEPVAIDCGLIDVDRNGQMDCLVLDKYGQLGALNAANGRWFWLYKEHAAYALDAGDFPIVLPDLDDDGVFELLLVSCLSLAQRTQAYMTQAEHMPSAKLEARNILRILSGSTGKPIGEGFTAHDCTAIRDMQLETGHGELLSFTCKRNHTQAQRSKTLSELYGLITNKSIMSQKFANAASLLQHIVTPNGGGHEHVHALSGRELFLANRGDCPANCNVTFALTELRKGKTKLLHNFTNSAAYAMAPIKWHFTQSGSGGSTGFAIKFWQWHVMAEPPKPMPTNETISNIRNNHTKEQRPGNSTKSPSKSNKTNEAAVITTAKPERQQASHKKRNINLSNAVPKRRTGEAYKRHLITESIMLVVFSGIETRIANISANEIVQFCHDSDSESPRIMAPICQPDLNNQEQSLLIADVDDDGASELLTHRPAFVRGKNETWKLMTELRLLQLQSELLPTLIAEKKPLG